MDATLDLEQPATPRSLLKHDRPTIEGLTVTDRVAAINEFHDLADKCTACHAAGILDQENGDRARPLFHESPCHRRVLFVLEAPNRDDTYLHRRLSWDLIKDPTAEFTRELLNSIGWKIDDVLFTNAVLCLPARKNGDYDVSDQQRKNCSAHLRRLIDALDPLVVATMGRNARDAIKEVHPHNLTREHIGQPHQWFGRYLLPLGHPSKRGQNPRNGRPANLQKEDIKKLLELAELGTPTGDPKRQNACDLAAGA